MQPQLSQQLRCDPSHGAALARRIGDAVLDTLHFIRAWMRDPSSMAAILPSGPALASLITRDVDTRAGPVLELGSGTGVFAAALIARGLPEADLTLVERDPRLARLLAHRYPRASVRSIDAADLDGGGARHARPFTATVCGLGLLNMPAREVEVILREAFRCMTADGSLFLFTYGRRCSVPPDVLDRLDLVAQRLGTTYRNLPPATVFRLDRRAGVLPATLA